VCLKKVENIEFFFAEAHSRSNVVLTRKLEGKGLVGAVLFCCCICSVPLLVKSWATKKSKVGKGCFLSSFGV
jgi:hypothetical protein